MSDHHPLATPNDPEGYIAIVFAVHNLHMRQALSLEQAWAILLQREHGPETMSEAAGELTRQALIEFDYREYLVRPVEGGDEELLWIRPDWPSERMDYVPFD